MYGKEETKKIKKDFWTAFGMVMKPHFSAEDFKINWINYKTEIKDIHFKMDATNKEVFIAIILSHNDEGIRELYWGQFLEFKSLLHSILEEEWVWAQQLFDDYGTAYSSISIKKSGNIFNQDEWQEIFAFLKSRLLKLDEFWSDAKDVFKALH